MVLVGLLAGCADMPAAPGPANALPNVPAQPTPPGPPSNINPASGLYDLTLTIGSECTGLPETERVRKYSARLDDDGPERYVVTLGGATFMQNSACIPLGCNQFRGLESAGTMRFSLDNSDEWHGGYITEQTASGGWIVIYGEASGSRTSASIEAIGAANMWHCPLASGFPFPSLCGGPASPVPSITCTADMRLAFTKK